MRSRDPSTGLLVQAGGQTVVEYLTGKNSLIQAARGDEIVKPPAIEVHFFVATEKCYKICSSF